SANPMQRRVVRDAVLGRSSARSTGDAAAPRNHRAKLSCRELKLPYFTLFRLQKGTLRSRARAQTRAVGNRTSCAARGYSRSHRLARIALRLFRFLDVNGAFEECAIFDHDALRADVAGQRAAALELHALTG